MTRTPTLDGLRAISILAVLSAHMLPLGPKFLHLNASAGAMGMTLFFALSGFLITSNLLAHQQIYSFFIRRLTRILPLAYLYLLVVYLTINPAMLPGNLLFIENYVQSYMDSWNAHFWSLCVEVHFYICIGLSVAIFGNRSIWLVMPMCFAVTLLRIYHGVMIDIKTHLRGDELLAGACVAVIFHHGLLKSFRVSNMWLAAALVFWFFASSDFTGPLQYLRPYSSAALLAAILGLEDGFALAILGSRPARYIAEISYALYVIHPATVHGWMNEGSTTIRYLVKRPISFFLTFVLAHVSTFQWEHRWMSLGKSLTVRKPVVTASS
ncbi:acyltransferase family protein [Bradyrhizobium genosp. P]|uniref:acyltransferase family protein n=1 Tax=Bradyrhizobium genosp. P TaxID=83641 RepID=UPI003CFA0EBC